MNYLCTLNPHYCGFEYNGTFSVSKHKQLNNSERMVGFGVDLTRHTIC